MYNKISSVEEFTAHVRELISVVVKYGENSISTSLLVIEKYSAALGEIKRLNDIIKNLDDVQNGNVQLQQQCDEQTGEISQLRARLAEIGPVVLDTKEDVEREALNYLESVVQTAKGSCEIKFEIKRGMFVVDGVEMPYAIDEPQPLTTVQFGGPPKSINFIRLPKCLDAKWDGEGSLSITVAPNSEFAELENGQIVRRR